MKAIELARFMFQVFAFGIFVYQMQNSVIKYLDRPVYQIKTTRSVYKVNKPIVYVCHDPQYNINRAKEAGYSWQDTFASGYVYYPDDDEYDITWKGKYGNFTYEELQDYIYDSNYSDLTVENYLEKTNETDVTFVTSYGFCMKLQTLENNNFMGLYTVKRSSVLLVDPNTDNPFEIIHLDNGKINFGPTSDDQFDFYSYELVWTLHDSSIYDGISCTNYNNLGINYGECVEDEMSKKMLSLYSCLPPWFPNYYNDQYCEENKDIILSNDNINKSYVMTENMMLGQKLEFPACLPPCLTMKLTMKELKHDTDNTESAVMILQVKAKDILVYSEVYAYDMFNLIVDMGSSLGLWLGLSALSIFDLVIVAHDLIRRNI